MSGNYREQVCCGRAHICYTGSMPPLGRNLEGLQTANCSEKYSITSKKYPPQVHSWYTGQLVRFGHFVKFYDKDKILACIFSQPLSLSASSQPDTSSLPTKWGKCHSHRMLFSDSAIDPHQFHFNIDQLHDGNWREMQVMEEWREQRWADLPAQMVGSSSLCFIPIPFGISKGKKRKILFFPFCFVLF